MILKSSGCLRFNVGIRRIESFFKVVCWLAGLSKVNCAFHCCATQSLLGIEYSDKGMEAYLSQVEDADKGPVQTMRQLHLPYIFRHPVVLREGGEEEKADDEVFDGFIAPRSPMKREKLASLVQKHFMPRRKGMWKGYYDPDGSTFVAVAVVYGACLYALDYMVKVYQNRCVRPTRIYLC